MNSIILMSHGNMAEEVLNSAKMIIGDSIDYPTVNMKQDDGIEGTIEKLKSFRSVQGKFRNNYNGRFTRWNSMQCCFISSQ